MKSFICLALSCLLIGLLYVYVRQQFAAQNNQIVQLTQLVSSMAHEIQNTDPVPRPPEQHLEVKRLPERVTVSDDSESEGDSEEESDDEEPKCPIPHFNRAPSGSVDSDDESVESMVFAPIELKNEIVVETSIVEEFTPMVLDLAEETTKTINLFEEIVEPKKVNYDKLTVKELKEMASKFSAPASLKTKKELIEFLEKK